MNKKFVVKLFFTLMFTFALTLNTAFSQSLDSLITNSELDKTATIAVSVKNAKTGKTVYEHNANKLLNPASSLKPFTLKPAYDTLGKNFQYKTKLYKDKQNNLYIKLSGDPAFTSAALKTLLQKYNGPVKDIVIDPNAVDYLEWGVGWMWDDDTNPLLPKFSQYTINENKITVELSPGTASHQPSIRNKSNYKIVCVNLLKNGTANNVKISRMPWNSGDLTVFEGTVAAKHNLSLPVDSTQRYFIDCLKTALQDAHLKPAGTIKTAPVPQDAKFIAEVQSLPLSELTAYALKNSSNLYTELIFKKAGAEFANAQGTTENGIKLFENYYAKLNAQKPAIVDASGVSRNDLICADWMSEALNKFYAQENFDEFETLLAKPIEGTLSDRLLNISRFLRGKTGTISGASSFTGYLTAKSGKTYSFAIIIQNFTQETSEIKSFEDKIINTIYKQF